MIKQLLKNRDNPFALKTALTKMKKITKNVADECAEVALTIFLEFLLTKCKAVSLPVGYFGLPDELWRETTINAIFHLKTDSLTKF